MKRKLLFSATIVSMLVVFSLNSLSLSGRKPFWLDEAYSLSNNVREYEFKDIIINGATGQGSTSPLDYLIVKTVDKYKSNLKYLHLQPHQYFRVYNLVFLWLAVGLISFQVFKNQKSNFIRFAFIVALASFLFNSQVAYFASEMRPYSIWTSLSFLLLFLLTLPSISQILLTVSIIFLALSTTASIYQITSYVLSLLLLVLIFNKPKKIFTLPLLTTLLASYLIIFYYILHLGSPNYPTPPWEYFLQFWIDYVPVIFLGISLSIYHYLKKDKPNLTASLTGTFWLLFGPLSFFMTQQKGFFFTPRQYIYYFPVLSLFLYQSIIMIFNKPKKLKKLTLIIFVLSLYLLNLIRVNTNTAIPQAIKSIFHPYPVSIPVNYSKLESSIPNQIPSKYELLPKNPESGFDSIVSLNFQVWWQYLQDKYPESQYPRYNSTLVVRDRDINFELVDVKK